MKKYITILIFLISLFTIISVSHSHITQISKNVILNFTNNTNYIMFNVTQTSSNEESFNHTFNGNEDYTFYIKIPKDANVTSATLNISGFYKCFSCGYCSYNPGTGPNCTCPTSGLSDTEKSTLNTSGSCPGGCSQCSYTPSCSNNCVCTNPYGGGGVSSCHSCSYTPSCSNGCTCTNPYSGGGEVRYTYYHTRCYYSNPKTVTSDVDPGGEPQVSWSCYSPPSGWTLSYYEHRIVVTCSGLYPLDSGHSANIYVSASSSSCASISQTSQCYTTLPSSYSVYSDWCTDSVGSGTDSAHSFLHDYENTECSGETPYGYPPDTTIEHICYTHFESYSTSGYPECPSGTTLEEHWTTTGGCAYCHPCTYTPSPPSCTCPSPGSGGGCASCSQCAYTPSSPDCTCQQIPGESVSSGSCPGGCEVCGYKPDLNNDCTCVSPYTGGGCSEFGQPENVWVDSTGDGTKEFSLSGWLNETNSPQTVNLNPTQINDWLSNCSPDENDTCYLPIVIHSDHEGIVEINNINITYNYNVSVLFNTSKKSNRLYEISSTEFGSPNNISVYGYYLNTNNSVCYVNGNSYPIETYNNETYCYYPFTVLSGNKWPTQYISTSIANWSDNSTYIPSEYSPNTPCVFNITWNDSSEYYVDIVILETNMTGTPQNYTMTLINPFISQSQNKGVYSWNHTFPAGTFYWRVYEKSSDGLWTITPKWYFTINKSTPTIHLLLNGTEGDYLYNEQTYANFTTWIDTFYPVTLYLYSNYTGWNVVYGQTPLENISYLYNTGVWNLTAYFPGDQNYTSSKVTHYFKVLGHVSITEGAYTPVECRYWGVSGINRCYNDCPTCYSEVGFKVRWRKTVVLNNTGTITYPNYIINVSIPTSVVSSNDVEILDQNNVVYPLQSINIEKGWLTWSANVEPGVSIWTINFNTTPPEIKTYNETNKPEQTIWVNITGSKDLIYNNVWSYINLTDPTIHISIYDNTTGTMTDVTQSSNYGPPTRRDLNGNGFSDFYQWITPSIQPQQLKKFVIKTTIGEVKCNITDKKILNSPVSAGENVEWEWTIKCRNLVDTRLPYTYDLRLPLEASNLVLNGNPVEAGFYTLPPYGPYIELNGVIDPYSTTTWILDFRTPPVTVDVSPPVYPSAFYVGQYAKLILYVYVKNWASETIDEIEKLINIGYGQNLTVYYKSNEIDKQSLVKGYYQLNITNLTPYETRDYLITYYTPTATAEIKRYFRRVINKTQYIVYPVKITSTSGYPLSPLYITFEQENPFKCSDVDFILVSDENSYLSPPNTGEKLSFRCSGNFTIVKLKDLPTGQSEYIDVFVIEEQPSPVTPFYKPIHDFFDWLYSIIKSFIEWITSFAR